MKTAAVIGWPVAHSKSPLIHRFWLEALGMDGDYSRFAIRPEDLGMAIRALPALGLAGVNVTVPHKIAVRQFLDQLTPEAETVGAVNTVRVEGRQLVGDNTDVAGFLEPLQGAPIRRAAVIGAGGAARAILVGLKRLGVAEVTIANRTAGRATDLLAELGIEGRVQPLDAAIPAVDLLVNASSLGMEGMAKVDFDLSALGDSAVVYDIVYAPLATPLLRAAAARGLRTIDGLQMLVGQAAAAFAQFFGQPPPRARDAELREKLLAP